MKDLTGIKLNRLTVLEFSHRTKHIYINNRIQYKYFWKCKCDCGNIVMRERSTLFDRGIKSCGCYRKEISKKHFNTSNPNKSHGLSKTRLYKIYWKMKERCYRLNYPEYYLYGGRGIEICDEWKNDFKAFYDWAMNNGYNDSLSIDRVDFDKNYCPSNCRWADNITQANNKRNNIIYTYKGETLTLPQWARKLNLPYSTLAGRRKMGKSIEEILNPIKKR